MGGLWLNQAKTRRWRLGGEFRCNPLGSAPNPGFLSLGLSLGSAPRAASRPSALHVVRRGDLACRRASHGGGAGQWGLGTGEGFAYFERVRVCSSAGGVYAGIGARETPASVLDAMEMIGRRMAEAGWVLRTGLSPGADQAFCSGARAGRGGVELYVPWSGFEDAERCRAPGVRLLGRPAAAAFELAAGYHPCWEALDWPERRLRARDVHEVLGERLDDPVAIVICWTADGSLDGSGPLAGGTGQALRVAHNHRIPVLNLARAEDLEEAMSFGSDAGGLWERGCGPCE